MAWEIIALGTNTEVASGNLTLNEPAGTVQGDLVIACIAYRSTAAFTKPGTDWTQIGQLSAGDIDATSGVASGAMFYAIRGASSPGYVFTRTAGDVAMGRTVTYRGQKSTSPFDVASITQAGSVREPTGTSLITAEAGELLVAMISHGDNSLTVTMDAVTNPGTASTTTQAVTVEPAADTWHERSDTGTNTGADTGLFIADAIKATAGATGTFSADAVTTSNSVMIVAAFKVAPTAVRYTSGASLNSLIKKTGIINSASLNSLIQKGGLTTLVNLHAYIQAPNIAQSADLNALVKKINVSYTSDLNALIKKAGILCASYFDAILSLPCATYHKELYLDALVRRASISSETSLDGYVAAMRNTLGSVDALVKKSNLTASIGLDAYVADMYIIFANLDALIKKFDILVLSGLDALIKKSEIVQIVNFDSTIQKAGILQTVNLDSIVKKTGLTDFISFDSCIRQIDISVFTSLTALLQKRGSIISVFDAFIQKQNQELQSNIDAIITIAASLQEIQASIDALIQSVQMITGALDAIIKKQGITILAGTDAMLMKHQSTPVQIDSLIQAQKYHVGNLDSVIKKEGIARTSFLDAFVAGGKTIFTNFDAVLSFSAQGIASVGMDGIIIPVVPSEHNFSKQINRSVSALLHTNSVSARARIIGGVKCQ